MPLLHTRRFVSPDQLLGSPGPAVFLKTVSWLGPRPGSDKGLVDQRPEHVKHDPLIDALVACDPLGTTEIKTSGEHAEPSQHDLFIAIEQRITPFHCGAQRLF